MEETIEKLREFDYYKQLILHGEAGNRNVLVEKKDGSHFIAHQTIKGQPKFRHYRNCIPGLATTIDQIERITVFVDGKEYEFVACQ